MDSCGTRTLDPARVLAVLARLPSEGETRTLTEVFGLLADPGRLRLLIALSEGELCVCDLAAACGQSESATSHALRLLRAHRVVQVRRAGRRAYYRLDDDHVQGLIASALAHLDHAEAAGAPLLSGRRVRQS